MENQVLFKIANSLSNVLEAAARMFLLPAFLSLSVSCEDFTEMT